MRNCELCNSRIPYKMWVDGKQKNLQHRKYCLKCSPFGSHNTKELKQTKDGQIVTVAVARTMEMPKISCSRCSRIYIYDKKKGHGLTFCNSCFANRKRTENKQRCLEYRGGKCQRCGYSKCLDALGFHHLDPNKKEFTLAGRMSLAWERLKKELDKCDLLCSNCHFEVHEELRLCARHLTAGCTLDRGVMVGSESLRAYQVCCCSSVARASHP